MNRQECANCLVHGWKQLEDETSLLQCSICKLIFYCSKLCQTEHWVKVHRRHCQYFADQTKNEPWEHKDQDCVICLQAATTGKFKLMEADNPNYVCIHKKLQELTPDLCHPHPFPITGDPGDIREKAFIVLWQLVKKFQLIHPNNAFIHKEDFLKVHNYLITERLDIWINRKIYPKPLAEGSSSDLDELLSSIEKKMDKSTMVDSFQLWQIIMLVAHIETEIHTINKSQFLKDPLINLPDDTQRLVSDSMNNTAKYLTVANDVLEALATKIIPYQEVLKIICGGSLEQNCSLCWKEVVVSTEFFSNVRSYTSNLFFCRLLMGKYFCGDCEGGDFPIQSRDMVIDHLKVRKALLTLRRERSANICDYCFQMTPVKLVGSAIRDIHRCSYCRTTMYCSMDCLLQDWQIHIKVCKKDKGGRKKKLCGSARRKVAMEKIEKMKSSKAKIEKASEDEMEKASEEETKKASENAQICQKREK